MVRRPLETTARFAVPGLEFHRVLSEGFDLKLDDHSMIGQLQLNRRHPARIADWGWTLRYIVYLNRIGRA